VCASTPDAQAVPKPAAPAGGHGAASASAGSSASASKQTKPTGLGNSYTFNNRGPLGRAELKSRIVQGTGHCTTTAPGGVKIGMKYAYLSQRGYYPDDLHKANQDHYAVNENFMGSDSHHMFCVLDGHGQYGDLAARYGSSEMPRHFKKHLKRSASKGEDAAEYADAYKRAFEVTNAEMHRQSDFDDMMSGTTAICVMVKDGQLHIANVGDSRAITCVKDPATGRLKGEHLSMDQTPYRKDERERCKLQGARVCTMSQLEGLEPMHENWGINLGEEIDDEGDPPRLFRKEERYPGVAFTRSFGDFVADQIGVFATPEQSTVDIHRDHQFLVIASDGVFEFITTQQCVDMVSQYENPIDACRAVVSQAYNLWLQYEVRTDDITMICVQFENTASLTNGSAAANPANSNFGQRPVRRDLSKAKRSAIMAASVSTAEEDAYVVEEHIVPKSADDMKRIEAATKVRDYFSFYRLFSSSHSFFCLLIFFCLLFALSKTNFLFVHLTPKQRDNVFKVMTRVEVRAGDVVIKQGDQGDRFYVVDQGNYQVLVFDSESQSNMCVHEYLEGSGTTNSFGELALMYNKPRAATVKASTSGVLWALDRLAFRCILLKTPSRELIRTLRGVDVLSSLSYSQVQRLTDLLSEVSYNDGDKIITQGDSGDTFFVIASGSVKIFVDGNFVGSVRTVASVFFSAFPATPFDRSMRPVRPVRIALARSHSPPFRVSSSTRARARARSLSAPVFLRSAGRTNTLASAPC
jgi:serine/threonine protein phosphatase PrpC/CRP-like cAMP-binding protein